MGLFFSSANSLSMADIQKIISKISSLDYKEKERIIGAFSTVDSGGISKTEFRKVIYELHNSHKISDIDYKNLKEIWEEKY
jgi:hypothetical protein